MWDLKQVLNEVQFEAVTSVDGPHLILAGAGSGKTRIITYRIAYLIKERQVLPDEILALTFTNKAANEMKHRVNKLLGLPEQMGWQQQQRFWISTFHSFALRILRMHTSLVGLSPNFAIYDDSDQLSVIKQIFKKLNLSENAVNPRTALQQIGSFKNEYLNPTQALAKENNVFHKTVCTIYAEYEALLKQNNAVDFNSLLFLLLDLLRKHPDVLSFYQKKFRYMFVDEYQDTNPIQYYILRALAPAEANICAVGDEDQSIYKWRGANIRNILNFEKDYPETQVTKLEQNYRSSAVIIKAASALISNNTQRYPKKLWTENPEGAKIQFLSMHSDSAEAEALAHLIRVEVEQNQTTLNEIAIFYRTNAQSRPIEDALRSKQIAYRIYGGQKFYDRLEIKDMLAYLRVVVNVHDSVSLQRIINRPRRQIGDSTVAKIEQISLEKQITFYEALKITVNSKDVLNAAPRQKVALFLEMIETFTKTLVQLDPVQIYHDVLEKTGYLAHLKSEINEENQSRIDNLYELQSAINDYCKRSQEPTLSNFLEEISLFSEIDEFNEDQQTVSLMTLHSSKGLEFPLVFITGMEEELIPSVKPWEKEKLEDVEEERRLCYVGMTRAMKRLYLLNAKSRRVYGNYQFRNASRFLEEIPAEFIETKTFGSQEAPSNVSKRDNFVGPLPRGYQNTGFYSQDTMAADDFNQTNEQVGHSFRTGTKIRHPIYGVGQVKRLEGKDENAKVVIFFNQTKTEKKFLIKFLQADII